MKLLLLGSGAREHALHTKLQLDGAQVLTVPGNPGIPGSHPEVDALDFPALERFCQAHEIGLIIVGPEAPLAAGVADYFAGSNIAVFGPTRAAARLESSKVFSKDFMLRHGVATGRAWVFRSDEMAAARARVADLAGQVVVKYDGLAAGKGVYVCSSEAEADAAFTELQTLHEGWFSLLLEEKLIGPEISIIGLADGHEIRLLAPSQDHKQLLADDRGPNTGGMGAYCPVPFADGNVLAAITAAIIEPTLRGLQHEEFEFRGFLYFGIMLTASGPKLLEYNVRLGDPEAEVILPQLQSSLLELIMATFSGDLARVEVRQRPGFHVGVVLASGGYPAVGFPVGFPISGLDGLPAETAVCLGGVAADAAGGLVTSGGRVLVAVGHGATLEAATEQAYAAAGQVLFEGKYVRTDIARRPAPGGLGTAALGLANPRAGRINHPARLVILLSGRGSNMQALVRATQTGVLRGLAEVVLVFSNDPAAPGLAWAAAQGLPTAALPSAGRRRAEYDAEVAAQLATHAPDLVLLAGYMRILSPALIQPFAGHVLNIHPADTRRHQGLHAYEWAWENRLSETQITVHLVDEGLDSGPIMAQQAVNLEGASSLAEVQRRGLAIEHELYAETVKNLIMERNAKRS